MNTAQQDNLIQIPYLPSGKPCPTVLTDTEVIELLRLEHNGQRTLKFYRDEGLLVGIRIGRRLRYRLEDVQRFLAQKVEKSGS